MIQNQYLFAQITTTKVYYYFVLTQLVLTLILTSLIYLEHPDVFIIQCVLASFLSIDILIRYFATGKQQFKKSFGNIFDCVVIGMLLLLIFIESLFENQPTLEEFSSFFLFARYGVQFYRLGRLLKQSNESRIVQNLQPISLDVDVENLEEKSH